MAALEGSAVSYERGTPVTPMAPGTTPRAGALGLPVQGYLKRKRAHLGPYCRPMPRIVRGSSGSGRFSMGEVPL